jgi:3',5'-nucleoside bisphosphate phosphatase
MNNGKVDLHIHTFHSDGFYSPKEIVLRAKEFGLQAIGITDHDSLEGVKEAIEAGKDVGIEVIPGVEISSDIKGKEIHILAYYVELENKELERYLAFFREERIKRAERIVRKLNNLGIPLKIESVFKMAENSAIGRPHIAQALLDNGYVSSFFEAFNKYIGNGCPAFESKVYVSPQSAFKIINEAGGLSFVAHPGYISQDLLKELIEAGVDGIEVFHPSHTYQQTQFYKGIVNEYFMLESGGSDFHGGKREDEKNFGRVYTTYASIEAMQKRLIKNSA